MVSFNYYLRLLFCLGLAGFFSSFAAVSLLSKAYSCFALVTLGFFGEAARFSLFGFELSVANPRFDTITDGAIHCLFKVMKFLLKEEVSSELLTG